MARKVTKSTIKKAPAKKSAATKIKKETVTARVQKPKRKSTATTKTSNKKTIASAPVKRTYGGFTPSPQQEKIFEWIEEGQGNAFIEAVAGAGKTTTLVEALRLMPGSAAFTAYNKKIAMEIEAKTQKLAKQNLRVGTFHSFGFNTWRRVYRGVRVDDRGKSDLMMLECEVPERLRSLTHKLVSLGKQSAVSKLWDVTDESEWLGLIEHHDIDSDLENPRDIDLLVKHAIHCTIWSRKNCMHVIDFDDMIWLPVVSNVQMDQYQWVLVDEAQDTNPARRLLAAKMLAPSGRLIMVGDRYQAIYGFTGADNDAVDIIIKEFNCYQLPLTVTYRCPKTVVAEAQKFVPHITAHETAPQGTVRNVSAQEFIKKEIPTLDPDDAILCRNTKPLIELAFNLIRQHIPCHVEGRDIGQGLIKLATRWKIKTVDTLRERLEVYREREVEKLLAKKQEMKVDAINDRVDTLLILMDGCHTIDEVVRKINQMFQDTNGEQKRTVTLSTVHKAKGREWDRVYILGWAKYMPSKWATLQWQKDQERNLQYVAITRSKGELVFLEALENLKLEAPAPNGEKNGDSKAS